MVKRRKASLYFRGVNGEGVVGGPLWLPGCVDGDGLVRGVFVIVFRYHIWWYCVVFSPVGDWCWWFD